MDRLKSLEIFKSVAEKGSFVKGADALSISCSAATRAVQELEASLGVQLLQRSSRRIGLTAVGREVLQQSTELLARYRALEATSSLSAVEAAGTVRLVAPAAYGRQVLVPALARFWLMHPRIHVDLRINDDAADVLDDDADLALCLGPQLRQTLIARRVCVAQFGLYAAPSYVARKGAPRHPSELQAHDCLSCDGLGQGAHWELRHAGSHEVQLATLAPAMRSNSAETVTGAAVHGVGIVLLPDLLAADLVRQGRLQPVLPGWQAEPVAVYLAYGSRHQPLRVRKLLDHLLEAIPTLGDGAVSRPSAQNETRPVSNLRWRGGLEASAAGSSFAA
jgi:LysR family transcriptional regulator, regulator for bpeEF and oprC